MKTLALLLFVLLLSGVSYADPIKPCPVTSPRCAPVVYIPRSQLIVIWWGDYYCRFRSEPQVPYLLCKPVYLAGVHVGWLFAPGR